MDAPTSCPLCGDDYRTESDLRVHLEVEHRKSELAVFVLDRVAGRADAPDERDLWSPTV